MNLSLIFFFIGIWSCCCLSIKGIKLKQEGITTNNPCFYESKENCTKCNEKPSLCQPPSKRLLNIGNVQENPSIESNQVCFYLKKNYRGESLCIKGGETINLCDAKYGTVRLPDKTIEGKWCQHVQSILLGDGIARVDGKYFEFFGGSIMTKNSIPESDSLSKYILFRAYSHGSNLPRNVDIPIYELDLPAPEIPKIQSNQVCFYTDGNYRGESICMNGGEMLNLCDKKFGTIQLPDGNIDGKWCQKIQSILVGDNIARVDGKYFEGFGGSIRIRNSIPNDEGLSKYLIFRAYTEGSPLPSYVDIPINKLDIPDMKIPQVDANQACFYRQRNYRGDRLCIEAGKTANFCSEEYGAYKISNGNYEGLWCKTIKSILFGENIRRVDGKSPWGTIYAPNSIPGRDELDYETFTVSA